MRMLGGVGLVPRVPYIALLRVAYTLYDIYSASNSVHFNAQISGLTKQ